MDSMLSGFVLDPVKCCQLSLEEKKELVHQIAQWSKDAPEILSSFTRRELLEIICSEMGKERKYTGYTKSQMIDHLLKLVSQKSKKNNTAKLSATCPSSTQTGFKRKWHKESRTQLLANLNHVPAKDNTKALVKVLCQNVVCQASLSPDNAFCKRCSCCICHQYDDNKDPSMWLTCGADSLHEKDFCGVSCHLRCALRDERAGILKIDRREKLEGSYHCVSCGKVNGLMRTWRKQLSIAQETRRVDVLCLRISLSHKILTGTERYVQMQKIVESALEMLKHEVGPLNLLCTKMARGIVNRLSCGAEVQKICASAVEVYDSMYSCNCPYTEQKNEPECCKMRFEASPTSVIVVLECEDHILKELVGCRLWHRKSTMNHYNETPTLIVMRPEKRFKITNLDPLTEYFCKVSLYSHTEILGVWEAKCVTPPPNGSSVVYLNEHEEKQNTIIPEIQSQVETGISSDTESTFRDNTFKITSSNSTSINKSDKLSLLPPPTSSRPIPFSPITPCKFTGTREVLRTGCKKKLEETDYEYSVGAIKWLEHKAHISEEFRVKFLTWFSLKATKQERRVVSVFVDALIDEPASLAEQLMHTFMDEICCEQKPNFGHGFCNSLGH